MTRTRRCGSDSPLSTSPLTWRPHCRLRQTRHIGLRVKIVDVLTLDVVSTGPDPGRREGEGALCTSPVDPDLFPSTHLLSVTRGDCQEMGTGGSG